jgi:hypothetical protein
VRLVDELMAKGKSPLFKFMMYPGEFHYFTRAHVLRDAWQRVDDVGVRRTRASSNLPRRADGDDAIAVDRDGLGPRPRPIAGPHAAVDDELGKSRRRYGRAGRIRTSAKAPMPIQMMLTTADGTAPFQALLMTSPIDPAMFIA